MPTMSAKQFNALPDVAPQGNGRISAAQLNQLPNAATQNNGSGFLDSINRIGSDIGTGIGETIGNLGIAGDKLLSAVKGENIQPNQTMQRLAAGNNAVAQNEGIPQNFLDKALSGSVPYVASGALTGGSALPFIAGQSATGALMNPDHPISGAATSGALSALGLGALKAPSILKNPLLRPVESKATSLLSELTGGKGLGGVKKRIANTLKENYTQQSKEAKELYKNAASTAKAEGNSNINSLGNTAAYANMLSPADLDNIPATLRNKVMDASTNPEGISLENAHALQSELGMEASKAAKPFPMGTQNYAAATVMNNLRSNLRQDILNELDKGNAGDLYRLASEHYRDNVAPYSEFAKIVKGRQPNFTSVASKFANADLEPSSNLSTILEHGGDQLKNDIVAANLKGVQKTSGKINVDKLLPQYENLLSKGYEDYITPRTHQNFTDLEKRQNYLKNAKRIAGLGALLVGANEINKHLGGVL